MSARAKILQRLYQAGRVTPAGLRRAVADGTITEAEYTEITRETAET